MSLKPYIPPLAICAMGLSIHQGRLGEIGEAYEDRLSQNRATSTAIHQTTKDAQKKLVDSGRALARFKGGCIAIIEERSGQLIRMMESQPVKVARGLPTPLDDGEIVCNELGDTGVVKNGKPTDIARIAPEHEPEFQPYKNKLTQERIGK